MSVHRVARRNSSTRLHNAATTTTTDSKATTNLSDSPQRSGYATISKSGSQKSVSLQDIHRAYSEEPDSVTSAATASTNMAGPAPLERSESYVMATTQNGMYMNHWPSDEAQPMSLVHDPDGKSKVLEDDPRYTIDFCTKFLQNGAKFLKYGRSGRPKQRYVIVADSGYLHWSGAEMDPHAVVPSSSYLSPMDVIAITRGQKTEIFHKHGSATSDPAHCFSIVAAKRTLDLEASSEEQRDAWVSALNVRFSSIQHAKRVAPSSGPGHKRDVLKDAIGPNGEPARNIARTLPSFGMPVEIMQNDEALFMVKFLDRGGRLTKHGRKGKPKLRWINCGRGKLFWAGPNSLGTSPDSETDQCVRLVQVQKVLEGKRTEIFRRQAAHNINETCCFSLVLRDRTLDLEAENQALRNQWMKAIRFMVAVVKTASQRAVMRKHREFRQHQKLAVGDFDDILFGLGMNKTSIGGDDDNGDNNDHADGSRSGVRDRASTRRPRRKSTKSLGGGEMNERSRRSKSAIRSRRMKHKKQFGTARSMAKEKAKYGGAHGHIHDFFDDVPPPPPPPGPPPPVKRSVVAAPTVANLRDRAATVDSDIEANKQHNRFNIMERMLEDEKHFEQVLDTPSSRPLHKSQSSYQLVGVAHPAAPVAPSDSDSTDDDLNHDVNAGIFATRDFAGPSRRAKHDDSKIEELKDAVIDGENHPVLPDPKVRDAVNIDMPPSPPHQDGDPPKMFVFAGPKSHDLPVMNEKSMESMFNTRNIRSDSLIDVGDVGDTCDVIPPPPPSDGPSTPPPPSPPHATVPASAAVAGTPSKKGKPKTAAEREAFVTHQRAVRAAARAKSAKTRTAPGSASASAGTEDDPIVKIRAARRDAASLRLNMMRNIQMRMSRLSEDDEHDGDGHSNDVRYGQERQRHDRAGRPISGRTIRKPPGLAANAESDEPTVLTQAHLDHIAAQAAAAAAAAPASRKKKKKNDHHRSAGPKTPKSSRRRPGSSRQLLGSEEQQRRHNAAVDAAIAASALKANAVVDNEFASTVAANPPSSTFSKVHIPEDVMSHSQSGTSQSQSGLKKKSKRSKSGSRRGRR
jgi:hypothetical protein